MPKTHHPAIAAAFVAALLVAPAVAADWPNFRGPGHDGISAETGLKTDWTAPLPLVWEREVGSGFSGLSVVGDRVYTCGTIDRRQTAVCLNADTGQVVWQTPFDKEFKDGMGGDGPRATPTVHDGRVYVLGAFGRLVCLGADDGRELWSDKFNARPQWGYSGSVLIEGDLAIVSAGKKDGALLALDRRTGRRVWSCGTDVPGYASPYPFTFDNTRYVVGFCGTSAVVAETGSGREVLQIPWKTDYDINAAAPIYHAGHLLLSSGYKTGSALFKLSREGDRLAAARVWGVDKVLMAKFQSAVLLDGFLYASDEHGLRCVNFMTGEAAWKLRRVGDADGEPLAKDGTIVAADGFLYYLSERGELMIARASAEGFEPLTRARILDGLCWTVPTIVNGRLYARNLTRVVCFSLKD